MRRKLPDGTVILVGELGPGRWRWRTPPSPFTRKARVYRGDGSVYTKPPISARVARRRNRKRPTQPQHKET